MAAESVLSAAAMAAEAAGAGEHAAEHAAEHAHSVVYGPVNAVWDFLLRVTGLDGRWGHIEVPEHVAMALFVVTLMALIFIPLGTRFRVERPGKFQQLLEMLVEGLDGLMEDIVGHGAGRRYLPFVGALTLFILMSNLTGLFFFLSPPTQNLNTTAALAITTFLYYNFVGLRRHGLAYFKQFLGPVAFLFFLFIPIEIISHMARALSLSLRLYGNIFGEHTVSGEFFNIAPIILPMPVMALGVFGSLLQTFIFVMLTMVYLAGAEATEH